MDKFSNGNVWIGLILILILALGLFWYTKKDREVSFEQRFECKTLGQKLLDSRASQYISVRDSWFVYHEKLDTCLYIADEIVSKDANGYSDRLIVIDVLTNEAIYSDVILAGDEVSTNAEKLERFDRIKDLYMSGGEIPQVQISTES